MIEGGASEALSVSSALAIAKGRLEQIALTIIGEVSELSSNASYKAVYFTIKDASSALPCMMWSNKYRTCGTELRIGSLVEVRGRFSLYAAKGRMSFSVDRIALAGEGDLRLRVANLAKRLEAEGLMRREAKRAVPAFPARIGLVTSPNGAAVYDVLRTLRRRFPIADVAFAGVKVEGPDAPDALVEALRLLDGRGLDAILLVRGGGSFEDLMPFNDEGLARCIASLSTPVVTGIGHEPDTSIADMVADLRTSTPTAAAEAITPDVADLSALLGSTASRMRAAASEAAREARHALVIRASRPALADPMRLIAEQAQALDIAASRLEGAIPRSLERSRIRLALATEGLRSMGRTLCAAEARRLGLCAASLAHAGPRILAPSKERVRIAAAALSGLSPLAILARGYSCAFGPDGSIIKSIGQVQPGSRLALRVSDGTIDCEALATTGAQERSDQREGERDD